MTTKTLTKTTTASSMPAPGIALPALLLAAAGILPARSLFAQEIHRLDGPEVAVYNLAGAVEVVPGEGPGVVIEVTRGGADRDRLDIEMGRVGGREALRVIYPGDRIVYERMGRSTTTMRVRDDGTFFGGWRGGDEVRISGRGDGLEAHADITVRVPPGIGVAVYLAVGAGRAGDLEADLTFQTGSGSVVVTGVAGSVDVDTGSGSVTISGVEGDVSADTGSGSIGLEEIYGSRLTADTGSGRVEGRNLTLRELHVDTGSGRIQFSELTATEIECDTGSGSVRLELLSDVDRLIVDTGSGSVVVEVPEDFGAELELDTGSGRIEVDVPDRVATVARRDYFRGRVGDGDGRVVIDTGSGGVAIRRN